MGYMSDISVTGYTDDPCDNETIYFDDLCERGGASRRGGHSFFFLFKELDRIPFKWVIARDENRAVDVERLREDILGRYWREMLAREEPSVLEVLVELSVRMAYNLIPTKRNGEVECLWVMLKNLGLDKYDDEHYETYYGQKIHDIVYFWMERQFGRDGRGSPFPLRCTKKNQKRVELWYQMHAYLEENTPNL